MNVDNKLIEKLQKLKAKQESVKEMGNLAEAEVFATKISELLMKHNLELADLDTDDEPEVDSFAYDPSDLKAEKNHGRWTTSLITILAEYNLCRAVFTSNKSSKVYRITLVGRPENVEVVRYLYKTLYNELTQLGKKAFKAKVDDIRDRLTIDAPDANTAGVLFNRILSQNNFPKLQYLKEVQQTKDGRWTIAKPWKNKLMPTRARFLTSFYVGAIRGINDKLESQRTNFERAYGDQMTALVLKNDAEVDDFMNEQFGDIGEMKSKKKNLDPAAYKAGMEAGSNMNVGGANEKGLNQPIQYLGE